MSPTPAQPGPSSTSQNVVLVGLRGSGKSSVGRLLAQRLGRQFADLDDTVPSLLGEASIADAFAKHGEAAFRAAEMRGLIVLLKATGRIIALGGGTPTAPGAAELLQRERDARRAMTVYLRAEPVTLAARLGRADNAHRPSLTGANVIDEVPTLFAARDPLYRSLADHVVQTDLMSLEQIADTIARLPLARS